MGAYIGGGDHQEIEALGSFGLNIGYAFQIIDDILDVTGREADLGKRRGMDILDGKPNLPLMIAMQGHYPGGVRVQEIFKKPKKTPEEVEEVLSLIQATDALDQSRKYAKDFQAKALASLEDVPDSTYRGALTTLAHTVVERKS